MYLEKVGNFDDAIKFYLLNIEIGEYLLKSSKRLSVLFKKVNRRHDIAAMYEDALNSANESLLPMATDKLKDELLKYQEEKNDSELSPKRMMKRLRENIANTQKAYDKAISEGKTLIAENAKIRLEKYESELKEIEDNITESSTE